MYLQTGTDMEVYHFSCLLSLKMARHLKMVIRSVRGLNTAAGLHDYSIAVICANNRPSLPTFKHSLSNL